MRLYPKTSDPWAGTVELLLGRAYCPPPCEPAVTPAGRFGYGGAARRGDGAAPATTINVLARVTDCTVTIAWSNPTRGSYRDQMWRRIRARASGVCALSGAAISHGDLIYRPKPCHPPVSNADAMILASVIDALVPQPE